MTRTVVLGLDGANWQLLEPWLTNGDLPNISSLLRDGVHATSHSFLPPVTVPNWKCYSTGKNPGKLGVYRFDKLDTENKEYVFHHSTDFDSAELWDYLNENGLRTGIVNMPTTYPPRSVHGIMVCGGPDARESEYRSLDDIYTYPKSLGNILEEKYDYSIHPRPLISSNDERGEEVDAIHNLIDLRFQVAYDQFIENEFDFIHVTIFYLNTLQHFFWREKPTKEAWKIIDEHIGKFRELDDTNIIIMSDHGCHNVRNVVNINTWLEQNGYLSLSTGSDDILQRFGFTKENALKISKKLGITEQLAQVVPQRIQKLVPWEEGIRGQRTFEKINWEKTQAVANAQGLVYLTRLPSDAGYDDLRSELIHELSELSTPDGRPVARKVHKREELYNGDHVSEAPDIVIEFKDGFHLSEATGKGSVFTNIGHWRAENIPPGIFGAVGPDINVSGEIGEISIANIAPTILRLMGCSIPTDMDCEPLDITSKSVEYCDPLPTPHELQNSGEDEEVKERLEDLGYLG